MGVDYTATAGIGYKVIATDLAEEKWEKEHDGEQFYLSEYLDCLENSDDFEWGEVGSGNYSGEENEYFLFIKDPVVNGIDTIADKKANLEKFIKDNDLLKDSEFDLHSGIHVW